LAAPTSTQEVPLRQPVPIFEAGKWGLVERDGLMAVKPRFTYIAPYSNGMAPFRIGGLWGFLDRRGRVAVEARYPRIHFFTEGLAAVGSSDGWGYVDRAGRSSGPVRFKDARPFHQGLAAACTRDGWGFVDRTLDFVIPPRFERAWDFTEGLAPVRLNGRWGFVDRAGEVVFPARYYWVDNFSEGLAYVEAGGRDAGYIDRTGAFVIRRRFWGANPFTEGLAGVKPEVDGPWGLIDRTGRMRMAPKYNKVGLFSEGLALVRVDFKWGYIDRTGKRVIAAKFSTAEPFSHGIARVSLKGRVGYIDRSGAFVTGPFDTRRTQVPIPEAVQDSRAQAGKFPAARIVGPSTLEARRVILLGNPYRKRYPDEGGKVFSRNIRDMILYRGRIYIGCGDYWSNTGPVDILSFKPGKRTFRHEYKAPDEMVGVFYVFGKRLVAPSNDPQESWAFGNLYVKRAGRWKKLRTIPRGLHVFELAHAGGRLYAVVSTDHGVKVMESKDFGKSWKPVPSYGYPVFIFPYGQTLAGLDRSRTFYHLEDGFLVARPMVPRLRQLVQDGHGLRKRSARYGKFVAFAKGHVILPPFGSLVPDNPQGGLHYLEAPHEMPVSLPSFPGQWITDALVRGPTLHLLCTRPEAGAFLNTVYTTEDLEMWRCVATFSTSTYARSFEEARGTYYVSLGCNMPRGKEAPPRATGDVLSVKPAPWRQ